jgi:predicted ATPase
MTLSAAKPAVPEFHRFGEALRHHRRAAGLSQEQLAESADLSPRTISGWERGEKSIPRRDTFALLVRALGLGADERAALEALIPRKPRPVPRLLALAAPRMAATRHNLTRTLDSFVGRERDLTALGPVVGTAPLVTLVGPGGVGKTRLAQELARRQLGSYADGVWFVSLADTSDSTKVIETVASTLGVRVAHVQAVTEYLGSKHALLVLDNCEHVLGACADLLSALLHACPELHVLATSREALSIGGEIVWFVRPLDLPDPRAQSAAEITRSPAVRLFVERARGVNPRFTVTDDNAATIARVCATVDGIPLALELAAARTRALSVELVSERLDDGVHLLHGTTRGGSPRHQSIRATIDWSHDLLGEQEQILLRRLAVFHGGFSLEMAEDVCSGGRLQRAEVLNILAQLVEKSLVLLDARQPALEVRPTSRHAAPLGQYRLLGPIRQYALERLHASTEAAVLEARVRALESGFVLARAS